MIGYRDIGLSGEQGIGVSGDLGDRVTGYQEIRRLRRRDIGAERNNGRKEKPPERT